MIAGVALLAGIAAHELGHRRQQGRAWRHATDVADAVERGRLDRRGTLQGAARRGAIRAGGPIASLVFTAALVVGGLIVPSGPVSIGLLVPAALNGAMLGVNLLPVAPTDGYALLRSALWEKLGNRAEADRRAIAWSRVVIAVGLSISLLVFATNRLYGVLSIVMLQLHRSTSHRRAATPARRLPGTFRQPAPHSTVDVLDCDRVLFRKSTPRKPKRDRV